MTPRLQRLPYHPDSADRFASIRHEPWAVFLDSGRPAVAQGRYDILSSDPFLTLVTRDGETEIRSVAGEPIRSRGDPLELLREQLAFAPGNRSPTLPFAGGAIGYFAYDLARHWDRLPALKPTAGVPEMAVGIYDWALVVDHQAHASWLVGAGRDSRTGEHWHERVAQLGGEVLPDHGEFRLDGPMESELAQRDYHERFAAIQGYIREGDCYQVNFARRFRGRLLGEPWAAYRRLRQVNPAPFAAYLNNPFVTLLSCSPERFLRLSEGRVETRPIKGTAPRSPDSERDETLRSGLARSAKDRAENLMIVDLLRNDLGRVCRFGTIRVPRLFDIESFSRVHHMVSTVEGELDKGRDALDLLRACFPGGSITGAPKLRAMELIEELEDFQRGIYCGSIGYIGFDGDMDSNIAIRTLSLKDGELLFWAGGGIVADSQVEAEFRETMDKAAAILEALSRG